MYPQPHTNILSLMPNRPTMVHQEAVTNKPQIEQQNNQNDRRRQREHTTKNDHITIQGSLLQILLAYCVQRLLLLTFDTNIVLHALFIQILWSNFLFTIYLIITRTWLIQLLNIIFNFFQIISICEPW